MIPKITPKKAAKAGIDVLEIIEMAKNAEACRDINSLRYILQAVWNENDRSPSFEHYNHAVSAELYRLIGFYLTTYGLASQKTDYQERGKNMLTTAVDLFELAGLRQKAAESYVILAFCYWNAGEVAEFEDLLKLVEAEYVQDSFDPVYLQIRINKLMGMCWNQEFDQGVALIKEISPAMEFCANVRLKAMFNNVAGMIYRGKKLKKDAIVHYKESMRYSRESKNARFIAIVWNNIAGLYSDSQEFNLSHQSISEAIEILTGLDDFWLLPHTIDTKANIYIKEGNYTTALETIKQAIEIFERGEDVRGLVEALWTKTKALLRLDRKEEALIVFGQLQQLSRERVGEKSSEKYARALSDEIYAIKDLPLLEEVAAFKKTLVTKALIATKGMVVRAAELLRVKNHKTLSQILRKQFPDLEEELGFKKRKSRNVGKQSKSIFLDSDSIHIESEIKRVMLSNKNYEFDFYFPSEKFETFYFDRNFMQTYGIGTGALVAVIPVAEVRAGLSVLVSVGGSFLIGNVKFEDGFFFVLDKTGFPIPLDEGNLVGEPIGFCPIEKTDSKFIAFSRLVKS